MERNDILNTNLLQLPMKAQAADEGAVQDIAPDAASVSLAGGAVELELECSEPEWCCASAVERCDTQKS